MIALPLTSRFSVCAAAIAWRCVSTNTYPALAAQVRSTGLTGSRKSRELRSQNLVPGVLYGVDDDRNVLKTMVTIDSKLLMKEIETRGSSFENTVYELTMEGENGNTKHLVTPRQTQFSSCKLLACFVDPQMIILLAVTGKPLSVNFLRYIPGNRLRIPIDFVNADQSLDLRRGCYIVRVNKSIECVCDDEVPQSVTLDLSSAQKGDVFRLNALKLPPKVRPAKTVAPDFVVCVVKSARSSR